MNLFRSDGDVPVKVDSVRVFVKRLHCKGHLELGKEYLIMGKDGSTTDSNGMWVPLLRSSQVSPIPQFLFWPSSSFFRMQYLLESNTWVERKPWPEICKKSANKPVCKEFADFKNEYLLDGCRQWNREIIKAELVSLFHAVSTELCSYNYAFTATINHVIISMMWHYCLSGWSVISIHSIDVPLTVL